MFRNARQAYEAGIKSSSSSRELEANALFKAARQLEECQRHWNVPDRPRRLEEALRNNQRLWTLFQTELTSSDHELPQEIRLNLMRISLFVDRRTFEVLAEPDAAQLQALIDINRNIAAGLARVPGDAPVGGEETSLSTEDGRP